jgi:hypothetical protein
MNVQLTAQPTACNGPNSSKAEVALMCKLRKMIDGGPAAIEERLGQLDREWTAGRAAKATLGVLTVAGLAFGLTVSLWWLVLPIVAGALLVQYLFGRSSLVGDVFRGMGFRPSSEIDQEKLALKALRGDFQHLPTVHQIEDREDITRLEGEGGIVVEVEETKVDPESAVREVVGATKR